TPSLLQENERKQGLCVLIRILKTRAQMLKMPALKDMCIKQNKRHAMLRPGNGCRGSHGWAMRSKVWSTSLLVNSPRNWPLVVEVQRQTSGEHCRPFMSSPSENFCSLLSPLAYSALPCGVLFKHGLILKEKGRMQKA